jgi:hypothetical protein
MSVPGPSDRIWTVFLKSKEKHASVEFLATKILLARLSNTLARDATPVAMQTCAAELHQLFAKNVHHPVVQRDLARIAA